ncbi:MAG: antibiotic biosynthesis monooxygenase [Crocinitomicaceae bacterium]|nr:antibiotic biosynthesis monooxygenase [Crocinitomicaceae bacterium]
MLTRIVKMKFKENHLNDFFLFFDDVNTKISSFEGCKGMRLIQDINDPTIIFTYSEWESEKALNNYRNSELFLLVWPKVKPLFSEKTQAWSLNTKFNGFP